MLFTGCEVRMRKTVPEVLKTARARSPSPKPEPEARARSPSPKPEPEARARRARDVFKTEGTVFLIRTEAAGK